MSDRLDYQAFYDLVTDLVSKRGAHTIYGRTDNNHSVIVGVRDGEVVCINCGAKRGMAALPVLREMSWGTFRVEDSAFSLRSTGLAPTAEVVAALSPFADLGTFANAAPAVEGPPKAGREAKLLCELLSRYIGPVAPVVCAEQIAVVGGLGGQGQLEQVVANLAGEIADPKEAEEFRTLAVRELTVPVGATQTPAPVTVPDVQLPAPREAAAALCGLVTDYLGPVAPIVCEEKIAAVGGLVGRRQLEAVIQNLALEIDERTEAQQFIDRARERFRAVLG